MSDLILILLFTVATVVAVVFGHIKHRKIIREVEHNPASREVAREHDEAKSRSSFVQARLRHIQRAPDPLGELVRAIRGKDDEGDQGQR